MKISKIYIDSQTADNPVVHSILKNPPKTFQYIENSTDIFKEISNSPDPVQKAKQILFLTKNKGAFIKKCPGTREYTCCDYKILHIGTFCTMDCSYCILQSYFHPPVLQFFINHDELFSELDSFFQQKKITRIGTGEYTDSLIWQPISNISQVLVQKFSRQSHAVLELKTKTANIEFLKNISHNRKTITAWSLNTNKAVGTEERKTASISSRLKAAVQCEQWGYPLAFHFDPLLIYDGCETEYKQIIKQLFESVSPENIVWISLGTFRFIPSLKETIQKRFPNSKIIYGEFIRGLDNKMRYFKPLRIKLYKTIISYIREFAPNVLIYFCMENDEAWEKSLGFLPSKYNGLPSMLDKSAADVCNLG